MDCIGFGQGRKIWNLGRKKPLSRPRRKCYDINEIDHQIVVCGHMECIGLGQDKEIGNLKERHH